MRQALLFLGLGLLGGFAVSAWWPSATTVGWAEPPQNNLSDADSQRAASLERQVAALRRELEELRNEVTRLGDVAEIAADVAALAPRSRADNPTPVERVADTAALDAEPGAGNVSIGPGQRRFRMRSAEGRVEALTEAGFSLDRAQHIERRVEELRVEAMQARYDAARGGDSPNAPVAAIFDTNAMLRRELGDADYERYLTAMGQSTRVDVMSVLASSAAEQAGMQSGDQIVAYGGQRVYDVRELNQALLGGDPGEPVLVDIVRDGQPMQLVLPRGPLGISGGFSRRAGAQ